MAMGVAWGGSGEGWAILGGFPPHHSAMSEEQLKAFMEAVKADARLQEKLNSAADSDDAFVAIAKEAGFVISADELKRTQAVTELSEEELEGVAGGYKVRTRWTDCSCQESGGWC